MQIKTGGAHKNAIVSKKNKKVVPSVTKAENKKPCAKVSGHSACENVGNIPDKGTVLELQGAPSNGGNNDTSTGTVCPKDNEKKHRK